ncbi:MULTISPECIES: guanylate kinase [Thermodesulfovibrio]|jgi:guanylate kinase|uniref:guanylate kinase n=1 Tax=Thermodesulfovibrio TaxID=28261 RepID=UPI00262773BF|nr:guanylate kinase [Thermodesulfovibrio sp.]
MKTHKSGIIFVISAPSGTGKTTICEGLLKTLDDLKMSVSHTTRKPRTGEKTGVDYHFVDEQTFHKMIENDEFVEWAEVYGNFYGTSKRAINDILNGGHDVLLDIDIQGAKNIKRIYPESVLIFILPPSIYELEQRLINRKEDREIIRKRLSKTVEEISQYELYDYVVINDNLERVIKEILSIITAERLKTTRINKDFINNLIMEGKNGEKRKNT